MQNFGGINIQKKEIQKNKEDKKQKQKINGGPLKHIS